MFSLRLAAGSGVCIDTHFKATFCVLHNGILSHNHEYTPIDDGEEVIHVDFVGENGQGWDDVLRQDNAALVEDVPMEESYTVTTPTEDETPRVSYRVLNHRLQNGVRLIYQIRPDPELSPVHLTRAQAQMLPQWESCERAYWRNRPMRHTTWERFQRSG